MPVFRQLLQRWGFVKLDRYGLMLTPEGRVLTTRPVILDDGTGGRIVGWQEDDLTVAELKACETSLASPDAAQGPRPAVVDAPVIPVASEALPTPPPSASAVVMAAAIATEVVVDEDDWEWTIALAKARAAETIDPGPPPASTSTWVAGTPATPKPIVRTPTPASVPMIPAPAAVSPRAGVPATVIPVPPLPTLHNPGQPGRFAPVVRTIPAASMNRFAVGTGTVDEKSTAEVRASAPVAVPTARSVALPAAARAVELPSQKRRNAPPR